MRRGYDKSLLSARRLAALTPGDAGASANDVCGKGRGTFESSVGCESFKEGVVLSLLSKK